MLFDAVLALAEGQEGETADLPDTGDLEADLKLVFRATLEGLNEPRYDAAMRALATEIPHDPALAADYAERLDGPLARVKRDRLRKAQDGRPAGGRTSTSTSPPRCCGARCARAGCSATGRSPPRSPTRWWRPP